MLSAFHPQAEPDPRLKAQITLSFTLAVISAICTFALLLLWFVSSHPSNWIIIAIDCSAFICTILGARVYNLRKKQVNPR